MSAFDPSKLLVAGDVTGNIAWMRALCDLAEKHGCDAVLQLGDFGYWPHNADGVRFFKHVSHHAERIGLTVYWIDGNHENHTQLRSLEPAGTALSTSRIGAAISRADTAGTGAVFASARSAARSRSTGEIAHRASRGGPRK